MDISSETHRLSSITPVDAPISSQSLSATSTADSPSAPGARSKARGPAPSPPAGGATTPFTVPDGAPLSNRMWDAAAYRDIECRSRGIASSRAARARYEASRASSAACLSAPARAYADDLSSSICCNLVIAVALARFSSRMASSSLLRSPVFVAACSADSTRLPRAAMTV